MAEQVLLNGRHARPATGHLRGEPFRQRLELPWRHSATLVKPEEQPACLIGRGMTELDLAIDAPGADQGGVEPFGMVGRQEQDASLTRADAIQGVEQPAQGNPRLLGRRPLGLEHAIDVLDQQQGGRRQGIDQAAERFVRQEPVAQTEHGHRQVQLAGRCQDQRRLAISGWTVQQVAPTMGDPALDVP